MSGHQAFASLQATAPDAGFCEWLRIVNRPAWDAMVGHRFCRNMATDRLPEAAFVRYLRYEHAFVRAAIGIFAHALAKAPTAADQDHLIEVLVSLAREQEGYFRRTFARLGLAPEPLAPEALPAAALGLRDGVLALAASGSFAEVLAAMLAAEWMYLTWCEEADAQSPHNAAPADWIRLHVEPGFRGQVDWLKRRLDQLGPSLPAEQQTRCADNFGRVLALEIAFHHAPYAEA